VSLTCRRPTPLPCQRRKKAQKPASKPQTKREQNKVSNIVSNITILQLDDNEIDELRDPTNDVQTFRLTAKDKDWVKDTSYLLSKEIRRGSVSQTDILRLSFVLFEKLLATHRPEIIKILERIK
jgi:hypothetical protein